MCTFELLIKVWIQNADLNDVVYWHIVAICSFPDGFVEWGVMNANGFLLLPGFSL